MEGKAIHLLAERYLLGKHTGNWLKENAGKVFDECVKTEAFIRWRGKDDREQARLTVLSMADFLYDYMRGVVYSSHDIFIEQKFYVEIFPGLLLSGKADIRFQDKRSATNLIWDMKATTKEENVSKLQLQIYGIAAMAMTGQPVESCRFVLPRLEKDIIYHFTAQDYVETLQYIHKIWRRIKDCREKKKFPPRETHKCRWCGVKEYCSGYLVEIDPKDVSL